MLGKRKSLQDSLNSNIAFDNLICKCVYDAWLDFENKPMLRSVQG